MHLIIEAILDRLFILIEFIAKENALCYDSLHYIICQFDPCEQHLFDGLLINTCDLLVVCRGIPS